MIRLFSAVCILALFISSCEKPGVDYPFENEVSPFSEAYEVSLILEPINAYNDARESMVMGNLQNGTSYSFETGRGLGYEVHLAAYYYDRADSLTLESIYGISQKYSQTTLWGPSDTRTANIEFKKLKVDTSTQYIVDAYKDEASFNYMMDKVTVESTTKDSIFLDRFNRSSFTDSVRYYAFYSSTAGSNTDSREVKGLIILTKPTVSSDFVKVNMKARVMYRY